MIQSFTWSAERRKDAGSDTRPGVRQNLAPHWEANESQGCYTFVPTDALQGPMRPQPNSNIQHFISLDKSKSSDDTWIEYCRWEQESQWEADFSKQDSDRHWAIVPRVVERNNWKSCGWGLRVRVARIDFASTTALPTNVLEEQRKGSPNRSYLQFFSLVSG